MLDGRPIGLLGDGRKVAHESGLAEGHAAGRRDSGHFCGYAPEMRTGTTPGPRRRGREPAREPAIVGCLVTIAHRGVPDRSDTEIYFLADRLHNDQRFYVFDQRAAVGLERTLGRGFAVEATASYLFDRQLFQGTSFLSNRTDVVTFDPGLGLSLQLLWRR